MKNKSRVLTQSDFGELYDLTVVLREFLQANDWLSIDRELLATIRSTTRQWESKYKLRTDDEEVEDEVDYFRRLLRKVDDIIADCAGWADAKMNSAMMRGWIDMPKGDGHVLRLEPRVPTAVLVLSGASQGNAGDSEGHNRLRIGRGGECQMRDFIVTDRVAEWKF